PFISDGRISIVVPGLRSRTRLTVSAKTAAPPSFRSSLATAVITTCLSPITSTDSATRSGSPQSSSFGRPVFTAQKRQPRVHVSPSIIKVAVCRSLQHSCTFGHLASSQTVFRRLSRIKFLSFLYDSFVLSLTFNHSGFLSIVFVCLFFIVTPCHSLFLRFFYYSTFSSRISCHAIQSGLSLQRHLTTS